MRSLLFLATTLLLVFLQGSTNAQPPGPERGGLPPDPVLTALDSNKDGELSEAELTAAAKSLTALDKNKDGQLTSDEVLPAFGPGGRGPGGLRPGGFPPFGNQGGGNAQPLSPQELKITDGIDAIPDRATFEKLSYQGSEVLIDTHLNGIEFVKFQIEKAGTKDAAMYFINTNTHRAHMMFMRAAGIQRGNGTSMRGVLVFRPLQKSPDGTPGLYTFEFEPWDSFEFRLIQAAHDLLIAKMPMLKGRLGFYPMPGALPRYKQEKSQFDRSNVPVYLENDLYEDSAFLPLNHGASFGRLRLMELDERPSQRDIVLYKTLPNEMPRVAGIITGVRQTPLSHVNLRAIQDSVPNAFITNAWNNKSIKPLLGKYVSYKVSAAGFEIRAANAAEVEAHFAASRPAKPQIPKRDLSATEIKPLDQVKFTDSASFGVKAANMATLHTCGFPKGTVPDGHAIPFYFYDAFMKHNGFYKYASDLFTHNDFQKSDEAKVYELKKLRTLIKRGKMPGWMSDALSALHKSYPAGTSLRCRSSTNNEDLPGFSGAGLYSSYTHHVDEGHLSKSIKQVFASLWNFRAFEEREFYRIDHFVASMGVLVHPNFSNEQANGVAVSDDILYQTKGKYYVNAQVGEDLVTNPDEQSVPEEILLDWWRVSESRVVRKSNRTKNGKPVLSEKHMEEIRQHLSTIHSKFSRLYGHSLNSKGFAMEIEFKITQDGQLSIKQARPWVYSNKLETKTEK
jgi:hypothetical protein